MTREEAITNLNTIGVAFVEPVTMEQKKLIDDTFAMAIQALSQKNEIDIKRFTVYGAFNIGLCVMNMSKKGLLPDDLNKLTEASSIITKAFIASIEEYNRDTEEKE